MNNTKYAAALCAVSMVAVSSVSAEVKPYVGLELSKMSVDYDEINGVDVSNVFDDSFTAVNPYVGFDINENLAVEVGYLQTSSEEKAAGDSSFTANTELKVSGFHVDAVGKYAANEKITLLGSVGLARLKADAKVNVTSGSLSASAQGDSSDTALRLGAGAEYALTDTLSARGMVRYMKVDFDDTAKNLTTVGIGLNYKF